MTATGSPSKGLKWSLFIFTFIVFALSVFGLLRGLLSLIISIGFLIYSGVSMFGIVKEHPKITKASYGLWISWTVLYVIVAIIFFTAKDWLNGGVSVAYIAFGLLGGWLNHKYYQVLATSPMSSSHTVNMALPVYA